MGRKAHKERGRREREGQRVTAGSHTLLPGLSSPTQKRKVPPGKRAGLEGCIMHFEQLPAGFIFPLQGGGSRAEETEPAGVEGAAGRWTRSRATAPSGSSHPNFGRERAPLKGCLTTKLSSKVLVVQQGVNCSWRCEC